MGRRRKNQNNNEQTPPVEKERKIKLDIAADAKKSVLAIFLFTLAALSTLGFFEKSGIVGQKINIFFGTFLGWAKFVFPVFLVVAGIIFLFKKEKSFYVTKTTGLLVVLISITGFFHWTFDVSEMLRNAKEGLGGGYMGYVVAYLFVKYLGEIGALVALFALFAMGIIVAFNFSIHDLFSRLFKKEEKEEKAEEEKKEEVLDKIPEEIPVVPEKAPEDHDADSNIRKIEFVEGTDQYVDPSLGSDLTQPNFSRRVFERKNGFNSKKIAGEKGTRERWIFPPLDLLEQTSGVAKVGDVEKNAEIIEKTLLNFGIEVERGEIKTGPSVTQYSFRPAEGVKVSKIMALQNDLSLALANPIRIEAPIPGKSLVGIEVPNKVPALVRLRGIIESKDFNQRESNLTISLGQDVSGDFILRDLGKMPHLLIAGATGTGKSVCINSIITGLLYQNDPENLKLIMIDPKRVELSLYNGIPHLLSDVVVENGKVINALKWAVSEMEDRYKLFQQVGARDIISYKEKYKAGKKRKVVNPETGEESEESLKNVPYIVIIIDELADLMGSHGKEVEGAIVRIAQMARAVGIHLIISTQRPSVEVITGLIKANITTRIAFQVATQIDSRTIIDMGGAEKLLGNGDLLFLSAASPKPKRIQGVFVSESEVKRVVKFINSQKEFKEKETSQEDITDAKSGKAEGRSNSILDFRDEAGGDQGDDLLEAAKTEVIRAKKASASLLQRRLRVGYARAARLLDILEEKGIIGPSDGAKPREVYLTSESPEGTSYENIEGDQEKRDKWQL